MSESQQESERSLFGLRFWLLDAAAWCLLAMANSGAIYADLLRAGRPGSWWQLWGQYLLYYTPWFLFTPVVFWWVQRFPLARDGWRRHGWKYLLFVAAWLALYVPTAASISSWISYRSLAHIRDAFGAIPFNAWVLDSVFLFTLLGIASVQDLSTTARRRQLETAHLAIENAQLSARLSGARLQMLRAQLEPHFLFNALNSITALIRSSEPETAVRSVGLLSELLRYATRVASEDWVTLEEEMNFVEAYLGFQQLRYGDRLTCHFDVQPAAAVVEIPPLILQPLLENAIRHGVEQIEEPSTVWLTAACRGNDLVIIVKNAPGLELQGSQGLGVGLANIRERLEVVYGQTMELRGAMAGGCYAVQLLLPREKA